MTPLAPGLCSAPPRRVTQADLDALISAPGPHRFPTTSRAGLLERALWPTPTPTPNQTPFVAVSRGALRAAHMLALAAMGAIGFVIEGHAPPERHAIVLALALGLPMAAGTLPDPLPNPLTLKLSGSARTTCALSLPEGARRVLPLTLLPPGPSDHWIELIGAQLEERHLANIALKNRRAAGVGLVRLEMLLFADPDLDPEGLTDLLTDLLNDLPRWPVAIRLTDWSDTKTPLRDTDLQRWDGRRGIAGIADTPAMSLQIASIRAATARTRHPNVWCLAPHLEDPAQALVMRRDLGTLKLGGMLESPAALDQIEALTPLLDGVWIGCGDLLTALGSPDALSPLLQSTARATPLPLHICG